MISEKLTAEVISELKRRHDIYVGFGLRYERLKAEHELKELLLVCCPALIAAAEREHEWETDSSLEKWFPITAEQIIAAQKRIAELETALNEAQCDIRSCDRDPEWQKRQDVLMERKGGGK